MLYDYIIANYDKDEPIFLSELPGNSKDYVRQEMKQLVDMSSIDKYSELTGDLLIDKLKQFVKEVNVDFEQVKEYISLFPDRVYRNIYQGGLMNELV